MAVLSLFLMAAGSAQPDPSTPAASPTATPTQPATPAAASQTAAQTAPDWTTNYSVPLQRQARNVAIISVKGEIDAGGRQRRSIMAASVRRRIDLAVRSGADALVIEIDTPGGEVNAVIGICEAIKKSGIRNTIAWVNPQALSGGAIIALACREIVTNDPATMGDAMPIAFSPMGAASIDMAELKAKVLPPLITEVMDSTNRNNAEAGSYIRDKYLSMAIVANDVELWWVRNNETGIEVAIDRREFQMLFPGQDPGGDTRLARIPGSKPVQAPLIDPSGTPTSPAGDPAGSEKLSGVASDLVKRAVVADNSMRPLFSPADAGKWTLVTKVLDGTAAATFSAADLYFFNFSSNPTVTGPNGTTIAPIRTDEDIRILLGASNIRRLDKSWSEGLVAFLTSTWVRGLLIACLLVCIFVELTHPGIFLPGIVALIAFLLLVLPAGLIGLANWWEVGAMTVGIALLAVELLVLPGFGVAGISGALLLFVGLVGTFIPAGQGLFPDSPRQQSDLLRGMVVTLVATATAILGVWLIFRNLKSVPVLNRFVLRDAMDDAEDLAVMMGHGDDSPPVKVGEVGTAQTVLRPSGRAFFGDQLIDVVADFGYIPAGAKVRVVSATTSRVGVEQVKEGQQST